MDCIVAETNDTSPSKGFKKEGGTTNKGHKYENLLIALLVFNLSEDKQVADFNLSSNNKTFGKFDDIVIEVIFNGRKIKHYFIQMKHTDRQSRINTTMLASGKGKYSIPKYFHSYKEFEKELNQEDDFDCILYTNRLCAMQDGEKFRVDSLNIELGVREVQIQDTFLNTADNFVYKFEANEEAEDKCKQFFEHFFLYPNQMNVENMKSLACQKFQQTYRCKEDCFTNFLNYVEEWSEREDRKICLNKENVKMKIGEILLKPFLSTASNNAELNVQKFLKVCLLYDVTIMTTELNFTTFNEIPPKSSENISRVRKEYQIKGETTEDEIAWVLWHLKQIPLVMKIDEDNKEALYCALKLFDEEVPRRKFLLIMEDIDRSKFEKLKVFQNLNDLQSNKEEFEEMVEKTGLCVQGREATKVKDLGENVIKVITVDELFKCQDIVIGEDKEDLPFPYIDQWLSKRVFGFEFINDPFIQIVTVLSYEKNLEEIKSKIQNAKVVTIEEFLQKDNKQQEEFYYIKTVVLAKDCTEEQFKSICEKSRPKACHLFFVDNEMNLNWINGNSRIGEMHKYLMTTKIEECAVFGNSHKKINIISGKPGAGKSVMLKYLKNTISPEYWIVHIVFRDHADFFKKDIQNSVDIIEYFLDFQREQKNYNSLTLKIRRLYKNHQKIVFLWDAMDELPGIYIPQAINTVQKMANQGFVNWVTTRDSLQPVLENSFGSFAFNIKEMDEQQQKDYIKKHLEKKHKPEELSAIIKKITTVIAVSQDLGFLGVPLRIFMLTDLFIKNPKKYKDLLKSSVTLPEIIQYFVTEKFNFCYKDKGGYSFANSFINKALEGNTNYRLLQYEVLALRTLLPQEVFKSLAINCKQILQDVEDVDGFGIITKIDVISNTATFVHKVYSEYFVATWMASNLHHVRNFKEFIFEESYNNIRIMFDLILARSCPAHIAVLHKDLNSLLENQDKIGLKDPVGRTPLHLACSWGTRHVSLDSEKVQDYYVLKSEKANSMNEDVNAYKKILELLVCTLKSDPFVKDELFNLNSVEYAHSTLALFPIEIILGEFRNLKLDDLCNFKDLWSVIYYCIKFDYKLIFGSIGKIEYVVDVETGNNLLHWAVLYQRTQFLEKIFDNAKYKDKINETNNIKKNTILFGTIFVPAMTRNNPLHLAALLGNDQIILYLIENGAIVDYPTSEGSPPVHVAAVMGQSKSIATLLEKGASVNSKDNNGVTLLHLVTALGDLNTIKFVLQFKPQFCKDVNNLIPFDVAVMKGRPDILDILMKEVLPCNDATQKVFFFNSLILAGMFDKYDIMTCLVKNGVDVNWCDFNKSTVLHLAAMNGHYKIVEFLLHYGADPYRKTFNKFNVLFYAVWGQNIEIVKSLIERSVDIQNYDSRGNNILTLAVFLKNKELLKILLDNGANINQTNKFGSSVLHLAALGGNIDIIKKLLEHGAEVNRRDNQGITPLHWAAYHDRKDLLEVLLRNGGDLNIATYEAEISPLILLKQPLLKKVLGSFIFHSAFEFPQPEWKVTIEIQWMKPPE